MLRSRRHRSPKRPRQTLTSCTEVHQNHITRMQCGEHPTNDRSEHKAMGTHSSRQHAKEGGGSSVQNRPYANGCSRDHNPTQKRLAEAETPTPLETQNHSQLVVLASIDLRSQHGRPMSARFSASQSERAFRAHATAGPQVKRRAGLIPDRAAEEQATTRGERGFERASRAEFF